MSSLICLKKDVVPVPYTSSYLDPAIFFCAVFASYHTIIKSHPEEKVNKYLGFPFNINGRARAVLSALAELLVNCQLHHYAFYGKIIAHLQSSTLVSSVRPTVCYKHNCGSCCITYLYISHHIRMQFKCMVLKSMALSTMHLSRMHM